MSFFPVVITETEAFLWQVLFFTLTNCMFLLLGTKTSQISSIVDKSWIYVCGKNSLYDSNTNTQWNVDNQCQTC
jgi:hypothetical protein